MMDRLTQAQLYLADKRGGSETPSSRSYHTFNDGSYQQEGRDPFGLLYRFDDDSLRAGATLTRQVPTSTDVLLVPVTGGLDYQIYGAEGAFLEPGQTAVLSLPIGTMYTISNPYETETSQFLQIWLARPADQGSVMCHPFGFDLTQTNTLLPLFGPFDADTNPRREVSGFIGQYEGRQEGTYARQPPAYAVQGDGGIFVFVLQGVFEVANRLLHEKDSLALWQTDGLEFEALSNGAILMVIDLPTRQTNP